MNRNRSRSSIAAFALVSAVLCSCDRQAPPVDLLARVGVREVRVADLEHEAGRRAVGGLPPLGREALLEELVRREAMIDRALKLGLDRDPELRRSWENLIIGRLRERELEPRLKAVVTQPAEAGLRPVTPRVPPARPEERRLAVLQLKIPVRASEEVRNRAIARLREARERAAQVTTEDAGFGPLAVDYSDDQATRYRGGVVGWFTADPARSRLAPEVLAAGFALGRPGEMSDVILTRDGAHLVKMLEWRHDQPAASNPDRTAALEHQSRLRQRRREIEVAFAEEIRRDARVELFPAALPPTSLEVAASSSPKPTKPPRLP